MQHHYVITHPVPAFLERSGEIPVMRDSYMSGYFRQEQKSGLMGIYENSALTEAWTPKGFPEWESTNELFADDLDRIAPWLERAIERMPIFGDVGIRRVINGAIPHTPDGAPLLGPAPGLRNFWMCCGTSFGIAQGGGCGKFLAQWMIQGDAEINMTEFDPRRFGPYADLEYVHDKVFLDYRTTFTTRLPGEEEPDARPNKTSPLYERLKSQGCVYTETFGWERPKWFSPDGRAEESGYRRNNVFEVVREEVAAVHERAGLLDLTGFAKYDITGQDAEAFLNRVCANRIPRKVGGIALVHLLSPRGRILGEMTVTKLAEERFYALSAAAAELRDRDLLTQSLRPGERVQIDNVTERRGVLVLSGPRSREILAALTDTPLTSAEFPWLTGRDIRVAGHEVRALRVSYVGELGWELHPRIGSMAALYEALWERGRAVGMANYGLYAVNSMRVEKGYKAWSTELTNELTLLEADMPRFFAAQKDDVIGKAATLAQAPRPFKIVYVEVDAADTDARGGEPVLAADGRCIGVTTSGAYGHRVKKSLAFACVEPAFEASGSSFDILLQGERRHATVLPAPAFDADNSRMRV
jgi:dimethylglycine dehydrogenase